MTFGKITKAEMLLFILAGLFLCGLALLSARDRAVLQNGEIHTDSAVAQEAFLPDVSPLDLNTATAEELEKLPRIGAELARRIVEYRTARGAFQSIEELAEVSGIGRETVELLSDQITVGDEAEE